MKISSFTSQRKPGESLIIYDKNNPEEKILITILKSTKCRVSVNLKMTENIIALMMDKDGNIKNKKSKPVSECENVVVHPEMNDANK